MIMRSPGKKSNGYQNGVVSGVASDGMASRRLFSSFPRIAMSSMTVYMNWMKQNKQRTTMPSDATPDTPPLWYPFDFFPGLCIIICIFPLLQNADWLASEESKLTDFFDEFFWWMFLMIFVKGFCDRFLLSCLPAALQLRACYSLANADWLASEERKLSFVVCH